MWRFGKEWRNQRPGRKMNKNKSSCTFLCILTGLATREDGAIKVCCPSPHVCNIKDMSLEEAWNQML